MGVRYNTIPDSEISSLTSQQLIDAYLPLVRSIASRIILKCPANIDINDLINVGVIGLMDAADKFSTEFGKPFRFYAELRIRGEILDELRNGDWVPRSTRRKFSKIERVRQDLEKQLGPKIQEQDVAQALGIQLEDYFRTTGKVQSGTFLSLEDLGIHDEEQKDIIEVIKGDTPDPDAMLRVREVEGALADAIRDLPHRERIMISLYYYQEMSLKDIGAVLGVTESRVSQMHAKALGRLRRSLLRANLGQA